MKNLYLYILPILLVLTSCVDDSMDSGLGLDSPSGKNYVDVTFGINMPAQGKSVATYALSESDEDEVKTIDILAFKVDGNDNTKEYFAYRIQVNTIEDDGATNKKKFKATLQKDGANQYRFVVLANARDDINNLGEIATSSLKEEILQQLIITNYQWSTDVNAGDYRPIPMWGETSQTTVSDNTKSIDELGLIRMVVRIDVLVDPAAQSNFKLTSVRLYNYKTRGHIVPSTNASHWDGTKVLLPTVPDPAASYPGPLLFDKMTTSGVSLIRSIYVLEAQAVGANNISEATALVIGGIYNNEGDETFYRIDFANKEVNGSVTYLNLLRNHLYNVKITSVKAAGYDRPETAFQLKPANITSDVLVWDQGGLSDIAFDGQYMLGISQNTFNLPLNQRTVSNTDNKLVITTDVLSGWEIYKIVDVNDNAINASWLTVDKYFGDPTIKTTISLLTTVNNTLASRTAYIYIKAGKLTQVIKVNQSAILEIGLSVKNNLGDDISQLRFNSFVNGVVPAQQVLVEWTPKDASPIVAISAVSGTGSFDFGSRDVISSGVIIGAVDGAKQYTIQPPAMTQAELAGDPFLEKSYRIDFTINNAAVYESKVFFLTQKNYAAVATVDANFLMDGSEQYITVQANAPWAIEVLSDPLNSIQQLVTTSGGQNADKTEEKIFFKTNNYTNDASKTTGDVSFRIKSTDPNKPFDSYTVSAKFYSGEILPLSNTYIIPTALVLSKSYLVPVAQANAGVAGSIGANDKLETDLVWTDDVNHVTSTLVDVVGRGSSGYLYVYPGNPQGNDVVALKVAGVTKWSWHLWITNYDPNPTIKTLGAYQLMDRNLGALSSSPGNYYSVGTYYQWGRKDPFPPAAGNSSNANEKIYNKQGEILTVPTSTLGTLLYTIQNPLTYLITGSTWNGSLAANSWMSGGKKGVYDPCPTGWRVPPTEVWASLNVSNLVWNATNKGRSHSTAGWFPASGVRNKSNGVISLVGTVGGFWSSTYAAPYIPTLDLKNTANVDPKTNYFYIDGASVRCIKE